MAGLPKKTDESSTQKKNPELKGTFISVMLLGVFIIVSWAGVYALFMSR
ncbi:cytochrome c oxidase subunit 2A [Virgibacillus dakarensis]|uniref:Cytochrome c oxidase subunit 2A n=1 Tax=Lentibacillus populi TaxID=1827502 RepID=A0A9W5TVB5_9BACI|nr:MULTISPECIES: cytochrome c oxidase subunit 2A [Bacillaceae]MBT2214221.1 cytochrome c oxidase subunit 2A [Virgibacillus dakarensis]MTW85954.1 cytochrome c oxidase subunit 2A [Virgibacillus dakarensis]GGB33110.1 hypothetical protein GCM10011409_08170 [Lentibacillus populi]